ncbi:MAG TPA: TraB/GumN family protein, partial [Sphingomicrobium sp.]|nr:TraB/GumN family protein [Sphingomicrobium sp.]
MRGRSVLAAMLAVLATLPAAALPTFDIEPAPSPVEQPALWVLSDADTTIYLFGTFHALDERTDWFARNVRAAFDSSDELVLETIVPTDPAELLATIQRQSLTAPMVVGAPILGSAKGSLGARAGQAMAASRSAGLTVDRGADAVLRRIADAQGKPVDGLESFEYQLAMLADLPVAPPPRAAAKAHPSDTTRMLLDMRSAWRRGDAS